MIYGIIGLGVVVVLLLALVVRQRQTIAASNENLKNKSAQLAAELETRSAEASKLAEQLDDARQATDEAVATNVQLREASAVESATQVELHEAGEQEKIRLLERIAQLEGLVRDDPPAAGLAETLWQLELGRSERTWRHSVATLPDAESPFIVTDNPLRLAVEIEAAALREDVGAFISVRWDAGKVEDPARSHLILRVAQELLAEASRDPEPLELVATTGAADESGRCAIDFELVAPDNESRAVIIDPPSLQSDVIDVNMQKGLVVSVR